jgi:hypothetical protein
MAKYVTPILFLVVAVLAVALFIRGGEVLTALAVASENSSQVTLNINAVAPTCEGVVCYDTDYTTDYIDLVGGGQRFVMCNATCTDQNGWGNMKNFSGNITNFTSPSCSQSAGTVANNVFCYVNTSCMNISIAGNASATRVECSWQFRYNAINTSKSGDWNFTIRVGDVDGLAAVSASDTIDLNELLAIGADATVAFGSKNANANDSTVSIVDNVYNYGNIEMDFKVNSSSPISCGTSTIAAEYLKVNLTTGNQYQAAYALTGTLGGPNGGPKWDVNLSANVTVTTEYPQATIRPTYWGIGVPGGVGGACSGYIWFAAVNS